MAFHGRYCFRGIALAVAFLVFLMIAGCSAMEPLPEPLPQPSPYSVAPAAFVSLEGDDDVLVAKREQVDWSRYDSVVIANPRVQLVQGCLEMSEEDKGVLAAHAKEVLNSALSGSFAIVPEAGNASLLVQATITGADKSSPYLNLLTTLALFVPVDNGGAAVELCVTDATSRDVLLVMVAAHNGQLYEVAGNFERWGHARDAMKTWAEQLVGVLEASRSEMFAQNP